MILIDTSIWIDHFRSSDHLVASLLDQRQAVIHPLVIGELAMGSLKNRSDTLGALRQLLNTLIASNDECLTFVERNELYGSGIGFIDAHLLAATVLTAGAYLWTRDRRLHQTASKLSVAIPDGRVL